MSNKNTSADRRTPSTDALDTLGFIIDENEKRDAIHLAVIPVMAGEELSPGDHIDVERGTTTAYMSPIGGGLGIVDPFLLNDVKEGEWFWLVIYPRQITSLRHVWTHPSFDNTEVEAALPALPLTLPHPAVELLDGGVDEDFPDETFEDTLIRVLGEIQASRLRDALKRIHGGDANPHSPSNKILEWALNQVTKEAAHIGANIVEMINGAADYVKYNQHWCEGGRFEGESINNTEMFWTAFTVITGIDVEHDEDDYLSCSC